MRIGGRIWSRFGSWTEKVTGRPHNVDECYYLIFLLNAMKPLLVPRSSKYLVLNWMSGLVGNLLD